jgi:hypothetical protein
MDAAANLAQRFLVRLENAATELRSRFPTLSIRVYRSSIGGRTPLDGHSVFIACLILDASDDTSDNVALEIGLRHIHTSPEFHVADVCWGAPDGVVEAELDVRGQPYTDRSIQDVHAGLTLLFDALAAALARGRPPIVGGD